MSKSIWDDKNYFNYWMGKLNHFPVYKRGAEEIRADLDQLGQTFLDIGGGDGRIKRGKVLDFQTDCDITKDWEAQIGPIEPVDVCFTSLVLITLTEEQVNFVIGQMLKFSKKYVYIFEEVPNTGNRECGEYKNPETKDKYNHFWTQHFSDIWRREESKAHPKAWEKIIIKL